MTRGRLVYGVATSDMRLSTKHPIKEKWYSMLMRCYSKSYLAKNKSYEGTTVCVSWLKFSNFYDWMVTQEWEGLYLDKDLLLHGSTEYSPDTCVFVPQYINTLLIDTRGDSDLPIGVRKRQIKTDAVVTPYSSRVRLFNGDRISFGSFSTKELAHQAWQLGKVRAINLAIYDYKSNYNYIEKVVDSIELRKQRIAEDWFEGVETLVY